jgi:hypothetical protein
MLFGVDDCVKSSMFGCDRLGISLVHRSISFRWLTRDSAVNKSRIDRFVARKANGLAGAPCGSPTMRRRDDDAAML